MYYEKTMCALKHFLHQNKHASIAFSLKFSTFPHVLIQKHKTETGLHKCLKEGTASQHCPGGDTQQRQRHGAPGARCTSAVGAVTSTLASRSMGHTPACLVWPAIPEIPETFAEFIRSKFFLNTNTLLALFTVWVCTPVPTEQNYAKWNCW